MRGQPGGDIAFVTQSGAVGSVILDWMAMKGYRVSKFISYGNATDLDESDFIEYLANDKKTNVICLYIEGAKDGRRFYETLKKVSRKKPVIILKAGTTEQGVSAVSSHTGSLAGSTEIFNTVIKQGGAIKASNIEDIFDFARTLSMQPVPRGDRVQIITNGGGFGVLMTDWVIKKKLRLAKPDKSMIKKMKRQFPGYNVIGNPTDLTGDARAEGYRKALEFFLNDKSSDMIAVITLFQTPLLTAEIVDVIAEASRKTSKPIIVISAGGRYTEVLKKSLEEFSIPTFSYPERAANALRALHDYSRNLQK